MIKAHDRIIYDDKILGGKPVIRGTRIPVELILRLLAQGVELKEILEEYPDLKREDVLAAVEYAHDIVAVEEVHPIEVGIA